MAKKVKTVIKLNLAAGEATPAPPVGPALGQHGVPIMNFIKEYNNRTTKLKGQVIPAVITVYEDRSFAFELKKPPVASLIKAELKIEKGSGTAGKEVVATITDAQVGKIAQEKMDDLNANDLAAAKKIVAGTARSMGIRVK